MFFLTLQTCMRTSHNLAPSASGHQDPLKRDYPGCKRGENTLLQWGNDVKYKHSSLPQESQYAAGLVCVEFAIGIIFGLSTAPTSFLKGLKIRRQIMSL